jgi:hypothetical protein
MDLEEADLMKQTFRLAFNGESSKRELWDPLVSKREGNRILLGYFSLLWTKVAQQAANKILEFVGSG